MTTTKCKTNKRISNTKKRHSKAHSKKHPKPATNNHESLLDLIKNMSISRNNISKSQNNLPAHLMKMERKHPHSKPKVFTKSFSKSFSNSASSYYSSVMKNGKTKTHSEAKEIINNSTKPFIEIKEMDDGTIRHYMVPKNTIQYTGINNSSMSRQKKSRKSRKSKLLFRKK